MNQEIRVGIVGCGGISRAHVRGYQQAGGARIVRVFDVNPAAADKLAQETGAQTAVALEALANPDVVDAVSICTPPAFHLANCRPFVQARIPVLCEKPLEVDVERAQKLAREVRKHRALLMVAFCHRFHPAVIETKRLIRHGVLGEPILFRNIFGGYFSLKGNHRGNPKLSGGGCLVDHCCHSMDLFRFLVGDPSAVQALAGNVVQQSAVEDFGMIHLSVQDRAFGEITASYSLPVCGNFVEWYGTKGTAIISYWNEGLPDLQYKVGGAGKWTTVDCRQHPDRFTAEIRHFLDCVRKQRQPSVTAEDGLQANRIAAAVYESVKQGKQVSLRSGRGREGPPAAKPAPKDR